MRMKNPDPITITLEVPNVYELAEVKALYEDIVDTLPDIFQSPRYFQSVWHYPAELYFTFPNKRKYNRFMKLLLEERKEVKIIARY